MTDLKPGGVFVRLLAEELQTLKRGAQTMSFRPGEIIFRQGDPGDGVYIVEDGDVEISAVISGQQRRVLSRLGPGTFFGEMAVLDDQPRSATATAASSTALSFIAAAEMWRALMHSPALLLSLVREFSQRMRQFDRRFLEEVLQAERLALVGRFAQAIVHDFKNPLNMIGFAADCAAGEDATAEHRTEARDIVRKQVDRMSNMITELLEFTRGAPGTMALRPVDYGVFVQQALREIEVEARDQNVGIECENEPPHVTVLLDPARLLHVFFNLINNAIDVMPNGGRITLRFSTDESAVATEFEDTGPGIAPEIAPRLFEPFATHGKAHGTGLGLSICKRIVEDHQGSISARSEPGHGAIFRISLPRERAATEVP